MKNPFFPSRRLQLPYLAILAALVWLSGCSYHYSQGQFLESKNRWEEAAIEYHLAQVEDPEDSDYTASLERANKVVARENMDRYWEYISQKEFKKAYHRLVDATRKDPDYEPAQQEMTKWMRVLVTGQVSLNFESLPGTVSLANQIRLLAMVNTPNPGEVIEGEIDILTGVFFCENLLYDPQGTSIAYYSLNSIGVEMTRDKTSRRLFSATHYQRLVNFSSVVVDEVRGSLPPEKEDPPQDILTHRESLKESVAPGPGSPWVPPLNLHYKLAIDNSRITTKNGLNRNDFTPRFLYQNHKDGRMMVDFGRYELRQDPATRKWGINRLPLAQQDYFPVISKNIALQPYLLFQQPALEYVN